MTDWFFTWPVTALFFALILTARIAIRRKERHPK